MLLASGSLGDRFGRKGALQLGLVIFAVCSTLAASSSTTSQLIASAAAVAARAPVGSWAPILDAARRAFLDGMVVGVGVGVRVTAVATALGAALALIALPARSRLAPQFDAAREPSTDVLQIDALAAAARTRDTDGATRPAHVSVSLKRVTSSRQWRSAAASS